LECAGLAALLPEPKAATGRRTPNSFLLDDEVEQPGAMLTKSSADEIESFLSDASHLRGGRADRVVFPESAEEVADVLRRATADKTPVTVSGAGTGTVGGRIPFAGIVLATEKLKQIKSIGHEDRGGRVVAEAGVRLADLQRFPPSAVVFLAAPLRRTPPARAPSSMDQPGTTCSGSKWRWQMAT
jgi:hypothetical protein